MTDPETGLRPPFGICGAVFEHWLDLAAEADGTPLREQIDMLSLPTDALPWFFIHVRVGDRYQNRLSGSKLAGAFGFEPKGRFLDEMMAPEIYPERVRLFDHCLNDTTPIHYRATLAAPDRQHIAFSRILLPLRSAADALVDMVCGTMVFFGDAQLSDDERQRIGSGYRGVLVCRQYQHGEWVSLQA